MTNKIRILLLLLVIGSTSLVLSLTLPLPDGLKWTFLVIAVLFNITSAIGLMVIGVKKTRE
ncbi:hypothetical protein [Sporosarcina highlanderae]|uniref:Uncharacterized protein n=1 Tax=Sporosarcina highlanderae TaxID=3035916 RepID=A0ABT8JSI7_9BACL|nr:hypothetical protein [Sporosarcina highlanderae]MDN4608044.1 hypothetical protein [Sporosarcina highlanderae]